MEKGINKKKICKQEAKEGEDVQIGEFEDFTFMQCNQPCIGIWHISLFSKIGKSTKLLLQPLELAKLSPHTIISAKNRRGSQFINKSSPC